MATKIVPKVGEKIPVEKFHVSKLNVRADEAFGDSEEDQSLIAQLRRGSVVQPFKARLEDEGYGVVVGRRRFLAKKTLGAKSFVVGVDCLISEMKDGEAREASLIENLEILRQNMNPIVRARAFSQVVTFSSSGLRGTARRLGMSPSTLSEYIKVLELSPKMQDALARGLLPYKDGLDIARMGLGTDLQDKLAEILEKEGIDNFRDELVRISEGKEKRGIPRGVYELSRVIWDKRNRKEMGYYEILAKVAEKKQMKVPEYIKDFVIRHIDEIRKEA